MVQRTKFLAVHLVQAAQVISQTGATAGPLEDIQQVDMDLLEWLLFTVTNKGNSKWH
jgi:hypothetical protein